MKQNKLTFDTENLVVHWLEISIEGLYDLEEIQALANYFDKRLELNSTFRKSSNRSSQSLISRPANKFNVLFVHTCLKYWSGTKLIFSGENGAHFYKLVQEKKVDWEITAWSVAKHAHHGPDFGLDPTKYGMTQADLDSIAVNGLINHINQGGTPPNANYVKALQKRWKAIAEHKSVQYCGIQPVMGKDCHVVKHDRTRIFLLFDSESGESFTGHQLTKCQSLNHDKNGIIGKNYKN